MQISNSQARDRILARARGAKSNLHEQRADSIPLNSVFPEITDPRARFLEECAANLTEVFPTRDVLGSAAALETILSGVPAGEVYVQDDPRLHPLLEALQKHRKVRFSSMGAPAESTQATLTLAHAFVAQTGSILTSSGLGGRGASIVPPCHVVYGYGSQIVPDISSALDIAQRELVDPSYVGLITGSSRTADIEKILVQGAHGPRRLAIILEG